MRDMEPIPWRVSVSGTHKLGRKSPGERIAGQPRQPCVVPDPAAERMLSDLVKAFVQTLHTNGFEVDSVEGGVTQPRTRATKRAS